MPEFKLEQVEEFEAIPDGEILTAEVINCEQRENPWLFNDDGTPKEEVNFRFKITEEGDWFGRTVFGSTSTKFNTGSECKLRMWVQELLQEDQLPSGFRFNTDNLIGMPCRVVIQAYNKKSGGQGNRVQDVFRVSNSSAPLASEVF